MSPETNPTPDKNELESQYEINTGDVLFVMRNLKDAEGAPILDDEGKQKRALEDGWEVIELNGINPTNGREGIMLRNTNDPDELKFYTDRQLREIQGRAEADIMERASKAASDILHDVDEHSAEIAEEEPRVDEKLAEEVGEAVLEGAGVEEPIPREPATLAEVMSGEKSGSLKFDMEQARIKAAEREANQVIPTADIEDAHMLGNHYLEMVAIAQQYPGPDGEYQIRNMDSAIVSTMDSVLNRVEKSGLGAEAAAFEIGVLLSTVRDYHAAEAAIRKLDMAEGLFPEDQKRDILEAAEAIRDMALRQGSEGEHFAREAYDVDQRAYTRLEANGNKPDLVYSAQLGMGVGLYTRLGQGQMGNAYGRLSGALAHLKNFQK